MQTEVNRPCMVENREEVGHECIIYQVRIDLRQRICTHCEENKVRAQAVHQYDIYCSECIINHITRLKQQGYQVYEFVILK